MADKYPAQSFIEQIEQNVRDRSVERALQECSLSVKRRFGDGKGATA